MDKIVTVGEAIALLCQGKVGVLPTDTVYGLTARAVNPPAVQRLYELKHREQKPGTVIAASIEQLVELGVKARYLKAVERFWPNPLSVIVFVGEELAYLHQGLHSLPFRIPAQQSFRDVLERTGPLASSSANSPGQPPANTVQEAIAYFGDQVDFYVDGGDLSGNEASTIIRVVDDAIEIIRPGAFRIDEEGHTGEATS